MIIKQVCNKFSQVPYEKEELVSIRLLGLIKSVDTFDIEKKLSFQLTLLNVSIMKS